MNFSSSLTDPQLPLVVDTSVLISIQSCGQGEKIFSSIPNPIIVPKVVADEFQRGTEDKSFLPKLVLSQHLLLEDATETEDETYFNLLMSLDDGESATIAIAFHRKFLPVIDERKGRAKASALNSKLVPGWSLDLLQHQAVVEILGESKTADLIFLALRNSHMRIPEERADEIISLIGEGRARECTCLPSYNRRFRLAALIERKESPGLPGLI